MARRLTALVGVAAAGLLATAVLAGPAAACAGLVTPGGNVRLLRTGTLAAYHAGVEHYITSSRFDANEARQRGQQEGDGTPIHLTIPVSTPWVPLRILGLGDSSDSRIDADVYLLTDRTPALLPKPGTPLGFGLIPLRSELASDRLLNDLRTDKGMGWIPQSMWFTAFHVGEEAGRLRYDLAVDASRRGRPSL